VESVADIFVFVFFLAEMTLLCVLVFESAKPFNPQSDCTGQCTVKRFYDSCFKEMKISLNCSKTFNLLSCLLLLLYDLLGIFASCILALLIDQLLC